MVDDNLEYMIGQVSGRGLGFSGRLGNTLYRIRQEQSYASKYAFDKSQYGPLAQHQTVNIEAAASPWIPGRVYRFISLISYPFILIGAGVGFWLSTGVGGWWLMVGTLVGGALGFATPRLAIMISLLSVLLLSHLLVLATHLSIYLIKVAVVLAIVAGAIYTAFHFYNGGSIDNLINLDVMNLGNINLDIVNRFTIGSNKMSATAPLDRFEVYDLFWGAMWTTNTLPADKQQAVEEQVQDTMKAGYRVISCTYGPSNRAKNTGFVGYTFWYEKAPDNIIDMLSTVPIGSHPMSIIGPNPITECPMNLQLAGKAHEYSLAP